MGGRGEIHNLRRESATTIYRTSKSPEGHKSYRRAITQKQKTRRNADRRKTQKPLPPQKELCILVGLIKISKPFFETVLLQCTVPDLKKKSKKKKNLPNCKILKETATEPQIIEEIHNVIHIQTK